MPYFDELLWFVRLRTQTNVPYNTTTHASERQEVLEFSQEIGGNVVPVRRKRTYYTSKQRGRGKYFLSEQQGCAQRSEICGINCNRGKAVKLEFDFEKRYRLIREIIETPVLTVLYERNPMLVAVKFAASTTIKETDSGHLYLPPGGISGKVQGKVSAIV